MNEIKQALRQLVGTDVPVTGVLFTATVKSVDWGKRECTVTLPDGREIDEVRLRAVADEETKGIVLKPKVESDVTVGLLEDSSDILVVLKYTEVDAVVLEMQDVTMTIENGTVKMSANEIEFNGGNNKGLVKVVELTQKINTIENDLNTLKGVFSAWTPVVQDGGGALKIAAGTWSGQTITTTQQADIENTDIKQ